jgi:hypothetical protein
MKKSYPSNPFIVNVLLILFIALTFYALYKSVSDGNKRPAKDKAYQGKEASSAGTDLPRNTDPRLSDLKEEVRRLYNSLLSFKDNQDFHAYGFGIGYKYNKWLIDVEKLEDQSRQNELFFPDFSVGDLKLLGFEYLKTKGRESDYTRWVRSRIASVLN